MTAQLTRPQLFERMQALPPAERKLAYLYAQRKYGGSITKPEALTRNAAERRKYAGHPQKYITDIFGWKLIPQQEAVLQAIEESNRVLIASATATGKSWILGAYGIYFLDAVAAQVDEEQGLSEQGARVLLPGPDAKTIKATVYSHMLKHADRAERQGNLMPGTRSDKSVLWRVRPEWEVEPFSPAHRIGVNVQASASGRHHRNMLAIFEEAKGARESLWLAIEAMCSGLGNKIAAAFNPTESAGPAFMRSISVGWRLVELSAFDHPNVRTRSTVVYGAIGHEDVDQKVRAWCTDRGPLDRTQPEAKHRDFLYALPVGQAKEPPDIKRRRRADGILGHIAGIVHVYRPNASFQSTVMGQFPLESDDRLFSRAKLQDSMARWKLGQDPDLLRRPPSAVGADTALEGDDDTVGVPRWGASADQLLRGYAEAQKESREAAQRYAAGHRMRLGWPRSFPKGDTIDTATALHKEFPGCPLNVDSAPAGITEHLARVLKREACPVVFGGDTIETVPGEELSENRRTQMYLRLAMLVSCELADLPDDPMLFKELLAQRIIRGKVRTVDVRVGRAMEKQKREVVLLAPKDEVKAEIGHSPDRSDAAVLSIDDEAPKKREAGAGGWTVGGAGGSRWK